MRNNYSGTSAHVQRSPEANRTKIPNSISLETSPASAPASLGSIKAKDSAIMNDTLTNEESVCKVSSPSGIITTSEVVTRNTVPVNMPPALKNVKSNRTVDFSSAHFEKMLKACSIDTFMFHLHSFAFGPETANFLERMAREQSAIPSNQ